MALRMESVYCPVFDLVNNLELPTMGEEGAGSVDDGTVEVGELGSDIRQRDMCFAQKVR